MENSIQPASTQDTVEDQIQGQQTVALTSLVPIDPTKVIPGSHEHHAWIYEEFEKLYTFAGNKIKELEAKVKELEAKL